VVPLSTRLSTAATTPWPDQPVPITLVITDLEVGGAERALVALATRLDRDRWAPAVIALGPEATLAVTLRDAAIPVHCLGVSRRHPFQALNRLVAALREQPPVLIQSFLFHANVAARLAAPRVGHPWVVGGLRVAERQRRWHLRLERATERLGTGSICVSNGVYRFYVTQAHLNPHRLTVIPNGIDPSPFDDPTPVARDSLDVAPDAFLTLFIGRLDPQKDWLRLLVAARYAAREQPQIALRIAGDGPDRESLVSILESTPVLAQTVKYLGRRDDIPSLLAAADLVVLPSRWEGMPNVLLEAMAAHRAVIATRVEGSEELVIPGETGWLVPPRDTRALIDAWIAAARDPDVTRIMGHAGRSRMVSHFHIDHAVAAYEQLWSAVLGLDFSTAPS
jgi:starch synthase (maltosyl-transferring)